MRMQTALLATGLLLLLALAPWLVSSCAQRSLLPDQLRQARTQYARARGGGPSGDDGRPTSGTQQPQGDRAWHCGGHRAGRHPTTHVAARANCYCHAHRTCYTDYNQAN